MVQLVTLFALFFVSIDYSLGLEVGLTKREFLSPQSYLTSFMNAEDTYSKLGPAISVVIKDTSFDFSDTSLQDTVCYSPGYEGEILQVTFQMQPEFFTESI